MRTVERLTRMQAAGQAQSVPLAEMGPKELAGLAAGFYRQADGLTRLKQSYRPYICPFELLIQQVPAGSTVLDVGCGAGIFLAFLKALGSIRHGVGFDSSKVAIAAAKNLEFAQSAQADLEFSCRSASDPWPEGQFDVVSVIDVIHHVAPEAQRSVISEAVKHVRPSGLLIYKDMCRAPFWRAAFNRLHDIVLAQQWIHYVPIQVLEEWVAEEGLVLVCAKDAVSLGIYGHELRVFRKS